MAFRHRLGSREWAGWEQGCMTCGVRHASGTARRLCRHHMAVPRDLSLMWVSVHLVGGWVWLRLGVGMAGALGPLAYPGQEMGTSPATPWCLLAPSAVPHPALFSQPGRGGLIHCSAVNSNRSRGKRGPSPHGTHPAQALNLPHPRLASGQAGHELERGHGDSGAWGRRGHWLLPRWGRFCCFVG